MGLGFISCDVTARHMEEEVAFKNQYPCIIYTAHFFRLTHALCLDKIDRVVEGNIYLVHGSKDRQGGHFRVHIISPYDVTFEPNMVHVLGFYIFFFYMIEKSFCYG